MRDMNDVKKFVASLPVTAMVIVLAGWLVATFVATFVAAKIGRSFVPGYGGIANALVAGSHAGRPAVPSPSG